MQTKRFSFVVDQKTEQEFKKIMEYFDTKNKNQTFVKIVSNFRRIQCESQSFRQLLRQVQTQDVWEQGEVGNEVSSMV
ncbi:MAG: hypothetical protein PVG65_01790 [Candidatus Thorarchaeota archaeon]